MSNLGFVCINPKCRKKPQTQVIDSRANKVGIRRRRKCDACNDRFTTFEIAQNEYEKLSQKAGLITIVSEKLLEIEEFESERARIIYRKDRSRPKGFYECVKCKRIALAIERIRHKKTCPIKTPTPLKTEKASSMNKPEK